MNNKVVTFSIVLLIIIVGALVIYRPNLVTSIPGLSETTTSQAPTFMWKFADAGESTTTGATMTAVTLVTGARSYDAGSYLGTCTQIIPKSAPDAPAYLPQEVSGIQCWFAGSGDEVGVFENNGTYIVKHGDLSEPDDSATSTAGRGSFTELTNISL